MQFTKVATLLALFGSLAAATPAPKYAPINPLGKRSSVTYTVYSDDTCDNVVSTQTVYNGQICTPYTNVRSISVNNDDGCTVSTWSGSNCGGSHYTAVSGCNTVLFASVLVQC